jgi:hypothetical protein
MGTSPVTPGVRVVLGALAGLLLGLMPGLAGASDDWDWDAVEAEDEGPVTKTPVVTGSAPATGAVVRRDADTAQPDFAAPPVKAVALFNGLPPFEVIQSQRDAEMHPCANCHQWVAGNPEPRRLKTPHDNFELEHGLHGHGKFWCFTCHRADKDLGLKTLEGQPVEFAEAYIVCSQCHSNQARDWAFGAHGKRVDTWQGRRQVYNCTACHYQHRPALKARTPEAGPRVRMGLQRPTHWVAKSQRPGFDHRDSARTGWKMRAGEQEEAAAASDSGKAQISAEERTSDGKS